MEANEAQELQEHAEHGAHESSMRPVAFTMSVLAVLLAVTTMLGHRTNTELVLRQIDKNDVWSEYQAKKIRANDTELMSKLLSVVTIADENGAKKIIKENADHKDKWAEDLKEEQQEAQALEEKVKLTEQKEDFFDYGETLLEIALVISSVTLLTRSRIYWYFGIGASVLGVASVVWGLLIH